MGSQSNGLINALRLGKKGQCDQMRGHAKTKFNDPAVAHGCLPGSEVDFDVMVIEQPTV
jgi:hypothetical protein